jgi:hypothetical protein
MMNERIAEHVEKLFAIAPPEPAILDIKEELLSALYDKYEDLLASGQSEETAYSLVISGIGDIQDLLRDYTDAGPYSAKEAEKKRNLGSLYISVGVATFVLSLAAAFLFSWLGFDIIGLGLMVLCWAAAVGLIVYGINLGKARYIKRSDTFVENYKEKTEERERNSSMKKAVNSALWPMIIVISLAFSFITHNWAFSWIIILVGVSVQQFINLRFFAAPENREKYWQAVFWTAVCALYFMISFAFNAWSWTWMIFIAAVALQQLIKLARMWGDKS